MTQSGAMKVRDLISDDQRSAGLGYPAHLSQACFMVAVVVESPN